MHIRDSVRRLAAATAVVAAGVIGMAGPVSAAEPLPDLQVTATVIRNQGNGYVPAFLIKNVGDAKAVNVRWVKEDYSDEEHLTPPDWAPFDLAPGESRTLEWGGVITEANQEVGFVEGGASFTNDAGEANPQDNRGTYRLEVPGAKAFLKVKAFVDTKGDAEDRNQPGLAGVEIVITDSDGKRAGAAKTDAEGWAEFNGLPVGRPYFGGVTGWQLRDASKKGIRLNANMRNIAGLALVPGSGPKASASATASVSASASDEPGLPVTGSSSGPLFGVGAGVLVAGGLALLVARRRRNRFVAE